MNDALGDRMKNNYEKVTSIILPRRTYTILRIDGKAFHTYTSDLEKPFDQDLHLAFQETTKDLLGELQGPQFAYHQSDEVSVLLTDFAKPNTDVWFGGNIQKMCSVSSSMFTAGFNTLRTHYVNKEGDRVRNSKFAFFDARVFTIPDPVEVANYFVWRTQDATRNSIQAAARSVLSYKECEGQNCDKLQDLMHAKGINWNDFPTHFKRGQVIIKEPRVIVPFDPHKIEPGEVQAMGEEERWIVNEVPQTNLFGYYKGLVDAIPKET